MATSQREERELLGHDAFALIVPTHQPAISALPPEELRVIATRLRAEHAKLQDLIREGHRAKRGKGDTRAAANAEVGKATRRKQVYAAALKRVNSRFDELTHDRRRAEQRAALREALARRQAQRAQHPASGFGSSAGMQNKANAKGAKHVQGGRIGSVSAQTKRAQARRDG
jgi:hypothetical protein